ncbi:hypothetical protein [Mesorhizobium abyssinicae]|uniref:hypothetical protein n=1 Tax=Mesorhizobium abyssinicae TaxID=1209958 RepID=UPI003393341B
MAHEETADCCGQLGRNFLQNSIFRQDKTNRNRILQEISGESYPVRGWPQKQAVVYTSDINGNGSGQLKATNHDGRPVQHCGYRPRTFERFAPAPVDTLPSHVPGRFKRMKHALPASPFHRSSRSTRRLHCHRKLR